VLLFLRSGFFKNGLRRSYEVFGLIYIVIGFQQFEFTSNFFKTSFYYMEILFDFYLFKAIFEIGWGIINLLVCYSSAILLSKVLIKFHLLIICVGGSIASNLEQNWEMNQNKDPIPKWRELSQIKLFGSAQVLEA